MLRDAQQDPAVGFCVLCGYERYGDEDVICDCCRDLERDEEDAGYYEED